MPSCEHRHTSTGERHGYTYRIDLLLHDQTARASRDQLLEDFLEVGGYLFECSFDSFVLPLVQVFDQLLNGLGRFVEFLASLEQLITLLCEVVVLFECFLVDMCELLERFVRLHQLLDELCRVKSDLSCNSAQKEWDKDSYFLGLDLCILFESFLRQYTQIADSFIAVVPPLREHASFGQIAFHILLLFLDSPIILRLSGLTLSDLGRQILLLGGQSFNLRVDFLYR